MVTIKKLYFVTYDTYSKNNYGVLYEITNECAGCELRLHGLEDKFLNFLK